MSDSAADKRRYHASHKLPSCKDNRLFSSPSSSAVLLGILTSSIDGAARLTNTGSQHFQGLRRAQQKAEANGALGDSPRKLDPTTNPITRRPGPGRGRPKKAAANAAVGVDPQGPDGVDPAQAQQQPQAQPQHIPQQPLPPQPALDASVGPAPTPMMEPTPSQMQPSPPQQPVVMQTEAVSFVDASEEPDEHAAKRAKLEENHDPALNDEAILSALAAHNNPAGVDHYNTE